MPMKIIIIFFAIVLSVPATASDFEALDTAEKIHNTVRELWRKQSLAELEKFEEYLLTHNPKTKSGFSALSYLNSTLESRVTLSTDDPAPWATLEQLTNAWAKNSPQSPIAHLSVAYVLYAHAWQFRGSGYAHTVKPEQWKNFRAYADKARIYLHENEKIASRNPDWYRLLLAMDVHVYSSMSVEDFRKILAKGLERYPDHIWLRTIAIDRFSPKWGGSPIVLKTYIDRDSRRKPKGEQDMSYAMDYNYVLQQHLPELGTSMVDCGRWISGNKQFAQKFPTKYNMNWVAFAASKCSEKAIAKYYFELIGDSPEITPWTRDNSSKEEFMKARAWALARE